MFLSVDMVLVLSGFRTCFHTPASNPKEQALQFAKCLLVQAPIWSLVFLKVALLWFSPAH